MIKHRRTIVKCSSFNRHSDRRNRFKRGDKDKEDKENSKNLQESIEELDDEQAKETPEDVVTLEEGTFNAALKFVAFFQALGSILKYSYILAIIYLVYSVINSNIVLNYFELSFAISEDIGLRLGFNSSDDVPEYPYGKR